MVKWYNGALPRLSREFDSPWPHTAVHRKTLGLKPSVFLCSKQTALLADCCVSRRHVLTIPNVKTAEAGEKVLVSVSELET